MKPIHKFNGGLGATLCNSCNVIISTSLTEDLYCEKCKQKQLLIEIMEADEKYGLYKINNMAEQTSVDWLVQKYFNDYNVLIPELEYEQAKQMEKEQMVKFAEFVSRYPDKNKNYQGEMLHAKSKYDEAERTIDLLEQYYNETYGK